MRLRQGELIIEQLTPATGAEFSGALLHHWRGTAFAPGAKAADFERLMQDFNAYPQHFSPQVLQARVIAQQRRPHAGVDARAPAARHHGGDGYDLRHHLSGGWTRSTATASRAARGSPRSTPPGTSAERALNAGEEHGFLWRLNTYWSYEERDGGLYLQIEAVSLTRSIPRGLGWAIRPYIESIPRESLEFTLRSACNALRSKTRLRRPGKDTEA